MKDKPAPVELSKEHFERAFQSKLGLKKYRDSIGGRNTEERAEDKGLRKNVMV